MTKKKENWEKLLSTHKDPANNFHISRLSKIGTKKDMIKALKNEFGDYDYVKELNENGEFRKEFGRIGNTYYSID